MRVGGRHSWVGNAVFGVVGPFASFAVGVVLGARISPILFSRRIF